MAYDKADFGRDALDNKINPGDVIAYGTRQGDSGVLYFYVVHEILSETTDVDVWQPTTKTYIKEPKTFYKYKVFRKERWSDGHTLSTISMKNQMILVHKMYYNEDIKTLVHEWETTKKNKKK